MVTDVYQYDPYGQVTLGSTKHTEFYGYNAESYNPNTGLEYLRARYYNPNQGRFFQEDSYLGDISDPLTLNRYAYTKNSPLNYMDPSGHYASYLTGEAPESNTIPYAAGLQAGHSGSRNSQGFTQEQTKAFNKMKASISQADRNSETEDCSIIELSDKAWDYLKNGMLGIFISMVKNGERPFTVYGEAFWKIFGIEEDYTSTLDGWEESMVWNFVTNPSAYYVGKLIGDAASFLLGIAVMVNGIKTIGTGVAAGAASAAGLQFQITAVSAAGVGSGIAITVTGGIISIGAVSEASGDVNKLKEQQGGKTEGESGTDDLKEVYNSIKESPNYPENFTKVQNGTKKVTVKNGSLLDKLNQFIISNIQKQERCLMSK